MDEYVDAGGFTHFPKNEKAAKKKELTIENLINYPEHFIRRALNSRIGIKAVAIACALVFLLGGLVGFSSTKSVYSKRIEAQEQAFSEATRIASEEAEAEAEKQATEGQKISLYRSVARALYGIRDYNLSDNAKRAYIQVMLNRADPSVQYDVMAGTDDLASVLAKPNQWQGYRPDGNYTEADFQLVKEFLESGQGNILNSDKYYWCEIKQGYIICKADINGKTNIPDQVVQ